MLRIYNTLTRQKEEFKPLKEGKVTDVQLRSDGIQLCAYRQFKDVYLYGYIPQDA